jgi:predicted nucleic acid-binding protein
VAALKAVFDTNILIDYLNGIDAAAQTLDSVDAPLISRITWMEVLTGAEDDADKDTVRMFLNGFQIVELGKHIAETAVVLRRERHLRLPDAIILACAVTEGCKLFTRNTRDFNPAWHEIHEPYRLPTGRLRCRRK